METVAGGPGSRPKKRKLAPLEASAKGRAAGNQGPQPGSGEDDGGAAEDRISQIPDAILGEIVSLLPTKEGARTQILASRWRHLWRSAPLNLDCNRVDRVISRILAAHTGPGRRLCLPALHAGSALFYGRPAAKLEALFRSPALDNLQELEFCYFVSNRQIPGAPLCPPASAFRFAATLRLASIELCHLVDDLVQSLHFPQLKHLELTEVVISEGALHSLIAGCPALECFLLWNISGFRCARINSLTIRSIGVLAPDDSMGTPLFEELVIENAPLLERLLRIKLLDGLRVSVVNAPKLETLCMIDETDVSTFDKTIKDVRFDSLVTMLGTVKILAFSMRIFTLDMVVDSMRFFPSLENCFVLTFEVVNCFSVYAVFQSWKKRPRNGWRRKHRHPNIRCLDIHLKTIVLESYQGTASEVNFSTFFIQNAKELESMTFQVKTIDDEFIAKEQRLLQVEKKASRGAQFHFTADRCLRNISDIIHVRDLDLTDPFVRRS
ncbi:hypothetical protein VPH35_131796 [Triticum aestivum]